MADHGDRQTYPARDARVPHREGPLSAERPVVGTAIGRVESGRRRVFASRPPLQHADNTVSRDNPYDEITSVDEFERQLGRVIRAAASNGIDPRGSWDIRNGAELPDWETMIVELEKPQADD